MAEINMLPFNFLVRSSRLAVIWVNGPPPQLIPDDWITLWNKAEHRLCTDGAANALIKICKTEQAKAPQIIVGDFDSISSEAQSYFKEKSELKIIGDQSTTDLTKALDVLDERSRVSIETRPLATVLLGGLHGRFDHIFGVLNSILLQYNRNPTEFRPIIAIDNENVATVLPKGRTHIFLDHPKITKVCGLFPFCNNKQTIVKTEGFRWNLTDQELEFGVLVSSSNQITDEKQVVTTTKPILFTFELNEPNVVL